MADAAMVCAEAGSGAEEVLPAAGVAEVVETEEGGEGSW